MKSRKQQIKDEIAKIILELEVKDLQNLEVTSDKIILKSSVEEFVERLMILIKREIGQTIEIERKPIEQIKEELQI